MRNNLLFCLTAIMCLMTVNLVASPAIIPAPVKLEATEGVFKLTDQTRICADKASRDTAEYLATQLRTATGYPVKIVSGKASEGDIVITTDKADAALGEDGYTLSGSPKGAVIRATHQAGAFYGVQSLLQLFPPQVLGNPPPHV